MRLQYLSIILFLFISSILKAQDPQFTQFYSNPLYQAPSFAGAVEGYRASLSYRDQWPSLPGQVTTATFALDYNLSALNSGLGLIVMNDRIGTSELSNLNLGLLYAYNVKINRKVFFRPGVGFYYTQRSLDYTKLVFPSELEAGGQAILPSEFSNVSAVDASVSGLLFISNLWMGFTADHLITPNVTFTDRINRLPIKYTLYGGYRFYKLERLIGTKRQSITVVGTYKHQGSSDQMDMGLYWSYEPIIMGVWYRDLPFIKKYSRRDALALLVGYKYKDLSVGYSYDFTISRLITNTGGAHEISLIYKFDIEQRKKFKPIPCPSF
jgi:type IX secretion system PorP/SprF family membrane protein